MILAIFVYALLMGIFGTLASDYVIWAVSGQDIMIIGDIVIGLIAGSFMIPAAVILWLLSLFGMVFPLMH